MSTINIIVNVTSSEDDPLEIYGSGEGQVVEVDEDTIELEPEGAECRRKPVSRKRRAKRKARMGFVHF